jgi:hypothetical protein
VDQVDWIHHRNGSTVIADPLSDGS